MNKPYNSEIIKAMAAHSDGCAAYASAMKWDWLRRQKVEDITIDNVNENCAFCKRWPNPSFGRCSNEECLLYKATRKFCEKGDCLFQKAKMAFQAKDQQAFTTAANDLYYQILSIIDDLYKPKAKHESKKEEVFYHVGQKFTRKQTDNTYALLGTSDENVGIFNLDTGDSILGEEGFVSVRNCQKITQAEFNEMTSCNDFTLIPDKK